VEDPELLVVPGERALSLEDLDLHAGLVVAVGREDVGLLGRDRGVAGDHRGGDACRLSRCARVSGVTSSRRTSLTSPLEHAALDGRADGHDLVGIDALVRLLADECSRAVSTTLGMRVMPPTRTSSSTSPLLHLASERHSSTGLTVRWKRSSVSCSSFARVSFFWMCFGSARVGGDEGQIDLVLLGRGEGDLGLLGLFLDALDGVGLLGEVDAGLGFLNSSR